MKYLLILILIGFSSVVCSQVKTYEISEFSGSYVLDKLTTADDNLRVEDILWEESFSAGIPADWVNTNFDMNNSLTPAVWEYRGPETVPNNSIGSRGSCEESGTGEGITIDSPSVSDGFVIFDSDYWDSEEGNCEESLGTGVSPAPHHASLTTSSFDFSDEPFVGFAFHQYLRNFNAIFKVQISIDQAEFEDVYVSEITATNAASPRDMQVRKDISTIAGGQSDVRIRFYFEQMYFFWMIDDLQILALEANNLELINAHHSFFTSDSTSVIENFDGLEYFQFPLDMPAVLAPQVQAENRGGLEQTNCALDVSVLEEGNLIESSSSAALNLSPEDSNLFTTSAISLPAAVADYDLNYSLVQNELDDSPDNNLFSTQISVTESTLARDEGATEGYFLPGDEFLDQQYEIGTVYQPNVSGLELHSISAGLGINTDVSLTVYAVLFGIDLSSGVVLDPIAITPAQEIFTYELNEIGEEKMKVLEFEEPVLLYEDSAYLAAIGTTHGSQNVSFAVSGDSFPFTSWAKFDDNTVFYLDRTPMVRMNFGLVTSVTEENPTMIGAVFPNPAADQITIEYDITRSSDITIGVYDVNGRLIQNLFSGTRAGGIHQMQVDVSTIPSGTYIINMYSQYGKLEETLIVE